MSKQIKMTSVDGVTLHTANKYVEDDIHVVNGLPAYNGENENGQVVPNTLKNLLDNTKSAKYLFESYTGDNLSDLIQYNDTENVTNFYYMFATSTVNPPLINTAKGTYFSNMYYSSRASEFPLIDTHLGTNFSSMYRRCEQATSFPSLNTHLGTNFSYMYGDCRKATSFPTLDTSNGTDFSYMYQNCYNATSFPALNTDLGTNFKNMYENCNYAPKIDITKFTSSSTSNSNCFCNNCYRLKAVIIRSFGDTYVLNSSAFMGCHWLLGTSNPVYNPNGEQGYVYIPRAYMDIIPNETNWSTLLFRALEDYTKDGTTTGEFDDEKAGLV